MTRRERQAYAYALWLNEQEAPHSLNCINRPARFNHGYVQEPHRKTPTKRIKQVQLMMPIPTTLPNWDWVQPEAKEHTV